MTTYTFDDGDDNESMVDLGGGMVVPLSELLEHVDEDELLDHPDRISLDEVTDEDMTHARMADRKDDV